MTIEVGWRYYWVNFQLLSRFWAPIQKYRLHVNEGEVLQRETIGEYSVWRRDRSGPSKLSISRNMGAMGHDSEGSLATNPAPEHIQYGLLLGSR
jgi:hypothetical protein